MESEFKRWQTVEADASAALALAGELDLPEPLARVLVARGMRDARSAELFMNPRLSSLSDPFLLPDMEEAVARVRRALAAGERILVFGDYDVDGVTGTALLVSVLRRLGASPVSFLPNRLSDGYGLTAAALDRGLSAERPGLVITVDCGSGSSEAVEMARNRGVDVIVTDHHEIAGDMARAVAVVNPRRQGDGTPVAALAGVGVAFKLCHGLVKAALAEEAGQAGDVDLRDYLELVALGTVADIVPLLGENRVLVWHGLARLNRTESPGLRALSRVAGLSGAISSHHIGFVLGPRLNAAGRLGGAEAALELLLSSDAGEADRLARRLDRANDERKRIEQRILDEATEDVQAEFHEATDFGLVAGRPEWHAGTIGIVASRLCAQFRRPVGLVAFDGQGLGRGSCRSLEGLDIVEVLRDCSVALESFGGHKMAAGLSVRREKFDAFRVLFNEACAARLRGADLRPVETVDAWIRLSEADDRLWSSMERLRPYGTGNPAPTWGAKDVCVVGAPRIVGTDHLRMIVACGGTQLEAVAFRMARRDVPRGRMDMLFELQENTYRGRRSLELRVRDFCPANGQGKAG